MRIEVPVCWPALACTHASTHMLAGSLPTTSRALPKFHCLRKACKTGTSWLQHCVLLQGAWIAAHVQGLAPWTLRGVQQVGVNDGWYLRRSARQLQGNWSLPHLQDVLSIYKTGCRTWRCVPATNLPTPRSCCKKATPTHGLHYIQSQGSGRWPGLASTRGAASCGRAGCVLHAFPPAPPCPSCYPLLLVVQTLANCDHQALAARGPASCAGFS